MRFAGLFIVIILTPQIVFAAKCMGKFPNPFTDVCWNCLFPLKISGATFQGGDITRCNSGNLSSFVNSYSSITREVMEKKNYVCKCPGFFNVGIPLGFFEPVRLVDVTRIPYCLVSLGGVSISDTGRNIGISEQDKAFYHTHIYVFPILYLLQILCNFQCLDKSSFNLGYLSEFDPSWNDDNKALVLFPESLLFANSVSVASCIIDSAAASLGKPIDKMFWCSGAQGTIYPFTGTTGFCNGAIGVASNILAKILAKLHRTLLLPGTTGEKAFCKYYIQSVVQKSQYKYQMIFPLAETESCKKIGQTEFFWQVGRNYPINGEDFSFLIWRKRDCCATVQRGFTG